MIINKLFGANLNLKLKNENLLYVRTREEWRTWLGKNGESVKELWLIFYKSHMGLPSIPYEDAVEEALCFGWIDSLIKKIDEDKYARKFTPRNENSKWSWLNVKRVEKMIGAGKMTEKGLTLYNYAKDNGLLPKKKQSISRQVDIPSFVQFELQKYPLANKNFESLAPSHKRMYIMWVMDAKKEETRIRRLQEMIGLLKEGKKLGLK